MLKKYFLMVLILGISFTGGVFAKETIIVSGHPEYRPIMYQNGNEITGIAADITREVFQRLGYAVSLKPMGSWSDAQQAAKDGKVDVLVAIYKNTEREKYLNCSIPIMTDPVVLFVPKGKSFKYHQLKDLIGKKGTTTKGDSWGIAFDQFAPNLTLDKEESVEMNIKKLASGQSDYFVFALYPGLYNINTMKLTQKIDVITPYIDMPELCIGITKSSKYAYLLKDVNAVLQKMKTDGTIAKLFTKYHLTMVKTTH